MKVISRFIDSNIWSYYRERELKEYDKFFILCVKVHSNRSFLHFFTRNSFGFVLLCL